ncbi:MAG TPA: ketoacyl-ACP synthase III [Firmicutes bacterium]|nr:ketoacyl-ACP synthase III [Bacillota bacterium]
MTKQLRAAGIWGTGSAVPERILTNADLEKMVDTSDEWITTRTGIKERRIADEGQATSDLAAAAGRRALDAAGVAPEELDLIIVATVTPDMMFPATACLVQMKLGAINAATFDLSAGCSGFVYALDVAARCVASGGYDRVLVIGAEVLSRITDWTDRSTCVLFGDGAGAAVVGPVSEGRGLLSSDLGAEGAQGHLLTLPAGGSLLPASLETVQERKHYICMQGNDVFKFAVRIMEETTLKSLQKCGLGPKDIDVYIPHQANIRIIDAAIKRLGIPREKVLINVQWYGNTSAASVPIALNEAQAAGMIKDDDVVVLVGFGAGLTWASAVLRWGR